MRAFPSREGLFVFFQNVSVRKRREEARRQSEERYRLLVEGAKDYAMILMDTEGNVTSWNAGAVHLPGWTEAEVLGIEGVTALLSQPLGGEQTDATHAASLALRLVAGVDAASRGGVARADMCVPVGVVGGAP